MTTLPDFNALFDALPSAYMLLDRDLRYVAANPAYLRMTSSRLEDLLGRHIFEAFPDDPADPNSANVRRLRASLEKILATCAAEVLPVLRYQIPVTTEHGTTYEEHLWSSTITPILGANGEVAFILSHVEQVTELDRLMSPPEPSVDADVSRAERAGVAAGVLDRVNIVQEQNLSLDAELQSLRRYLAQAPFFINFLRGPDHVFDLVNAEYEKLIGHRPVLGKPIREALPEVVDQGFIPMLDRVFATNEPLTGRNIKAQIQRAPGGALEEIYMDFTYQPVLGADGKVAGIFVFGKDVTLQKKFEEERQRFAYIVEQSSDFVGVGDVNYNAIFVNEAGQRMLGLTPERVPQTNLIDYFMPEDRPFVEETIIPAFKRDGRWDGEFRFRNFTTGEPIPAYYSVFTLRDPSTGEFRGIATVSRDISAQKRLEQERAALHEAERAARAEAERANHAKDEFLAMMSHELRTPLNAILGWTRMLRTGSLPEDKRARALETIERNAKSQVALVEDVLDVSRIVSGKLRLNVGPVQLLQVVETAVDTVRPAAEARGVRVQMLLDPDAGVAIGDPDRLQQVVWNLLSNAVKFTPKGGRVHVRLQREDAYVEIVVTDSGQGIAREFLPYVFERFRQADATITRSHGGLGLGLAIVKHIVELHGGTISADSEGPGKGASFTVHLPVAPLRSTSDLTPAPASVMMSGIEGLVCPPGIEGLTVVVLDDEMDARELVCSVLEHCKAKVFPAARVADALAIVTRERPDVIVSDIGMPEEDGYTFIRKLRELPAAEGGRTPAIALTAYARSEDRARAMLAGFSNHVSKPVEPTELLAVIASLSGRSAG